MIIKRSAELQRMELAAQESVRLGVPLDELKNLINLSEIDICLDPQDDLPSSKDILHAEYISEHPLEEMIRQLDGEVGLTLCQLRNLSKLSRTAPPLARDTGADYFEEFVREVAERLGLSVELHQILSRRCSPDDIEDIEIPHHRPPLMIDGGY